MKKGLGKGLSALLGTDEAKAAYNRGQGNRYRTEYHSPKDIR